MGDLEMKCESCGQDLPEHDIMDDFTSDDEQDLVVASMTIVGQCDCHHEMHNTIQGDGQGRCSSDGKPENGGLCTACLFGCAP